MKELSECGKKLLGMGSVKDIKIKFRKSVMVCDI